MKIQIEKNLLINAVNTIIKAVPTKTTNNILKCILIDATTEIIRMTCNDTELGIETSADGNILEHGIIAIDAEVFSNIVRKLPDNIVNITTNEKEEILIQCENSKFKIWGYNGEEFPNLPQIDKKYELQISQFTLREIISKTIFSLSTNETNKIMTGELFEINNNTLRAVSLDGHRISIRKVELKENYENKKVIIPGKTLSDISKILSGNMEDMTKIYITDRHILFSFDRTIVVSRLIEGNYFDVDQMISNQFKTKINIKRQEILSCLDRAILLVKEEDRKPIILIIKENTIQLKMNTTLGRMDEVINIEKEGNDLIIGFNPKFFIDALRAIDEEEINIYFYNQKSPAFIRDEESYCYMILPINFVNVD